MNAIMGIRPYMAHGYYNYQYYAQFAFGSRYDHFSSTTPDTNTNVMVIRNEHIADDWNKISLLLDGQIGVLNASDVPKNNPTIPRLPNEKYLSDKSKVVLCEVLCNEIQVYKVLIREAINLNDDDMDQSMKELRSTCPKEAMEDRCKYERPDFQEKIEAEIGAPAFSYMLDDTDH
jgi:hypothetical protein